ncbi:MAG: ABC transporter permease subunit [Candidatus Omnitrophica bacterium]|nr:ABC transporter permease subunit [Candidatus Omnitrophota bacterium]
MITKPNVSQPPSLLTDISVLTLLSTLLYGLVQVGKHWQTPLQLQAEISLSLWALPGYTLLSLLRGCVAYGLSLAFTLTYGYLAAHRPRAEAIMLPLLDILQSIPVLGFLPGAVLALVALFPQTNVGLELASILMIFTGQVWNMTFSFYQSLRSIPAELREAFSIYQFNWWQRFRRVELPASAIGLAWNSMMAMAGGWFFLMVCEAFTLGTRDFRLPGLGAYMSVAIAHQNIPAILAGIGAMVCMIVLVDTCLWRPVLVWAQKFRLEETTSADLQPSRILSWLRRSMLVQTAMASMVHPLSEWLSSTANASRPPRELPPSSAQRGRALTPGRLIGVLGLGIGGGLTAWGTWRLVHALSHLPAHDWVHVLIAAMLTFLRVTAAVALGSLWTVPVGIWIGRSARRCSRWQPFVQVAASFPAPMLYPLIVLTLHRWGWGLGVVSTILMLLGTQWYLLFNVIAGVSTVPDDLREVTQSYHFTPRQRWRLLWWPAVFPYLVTGWVTAAGGAWNASIVAEYVSVGSHQPFVASGLGSLISVAASQGRYELLAAAVLTMAVVVILTNRYCWKSLYRLAETRYAY